MNRRKFLIGCTALATIGAAPSPAEKAKNKVTRTALVRAESQRVPEQGIIIHDVSWLRRKFWEVKKGDVFRLVEADGTIADKGDIFEICVAETDAYFNPKTEQWTIDCEVWKGQ